MNQSKFQNPKLEAIFEKMASTPTYQGRKPKSLHDRGLDGLHGNTPLHVAVLSNDLETGKILLEIGSNPNAPGESGDTPLHTAIKQKNYEFVQLLLTNAAAKESQNDDGLSPADLVQQSNDSQLNAIFSSWPKNELTPEAAAVLKQMEEGEYLGPLEIKLTSVNARDVLGDTPLHVAEVWGVETGKILLEAGANPNLPGEYDNTPLHNAVVGKRYDFVELLLKYGASKDLINEDGFTPMDYAKQSKDPRLIELLCG